MCSVWDVALSESDLTWLQNCLLKLLLFFFFMVFQIQNIRVRLVSHKARKYLVGLGLT